MRRRRWQQLIADAPARFGGQLRAESILASREYAFCLYPAESLERLMD